MEHLHNGSTLRLCPGAFPLSTDSVLLSAFVKLRKDMRILDLGSGCGTLGILLCARDETIRVTGIELEAAAHETALENIRDNKLDARMESIHADLTQASHYIVPGSFCCCVSNPPYFTGGPAARLTAARREDTCTMEQLFHAAAWSLQYGGDFYLVHRPERLASLFCYAGNAGLEPKQLCLVRHDPDAPVSLVLVKCRKGAKPGLVWEDLILFDRDGAPTPAYREIYHL